LDTPTLDIVDKVVRIFGIPAIIGAIVWLVKTWTKFDARSANTEAIAADVKKTTDEIATNHLQHLTQDMKDQKERQGETIEVLRNIDTNISILVDRTPRG
jgi:hypothetical protein